MQDSNGRQRVASPDDAHRVVDHSTLVLAEPAKSRDCRLAETTYRAEVTQASATLRLTGGSSRSRAHGVLEIIAARLPWAILRVESGEIWPKAHIRDRRTVGRSHRSRLRRSSPPTPSICRQ